MQCPRCGQDNRDEARFCRQCGATFGTPCAVCGRSSTAESKFCDNCGAPLSVAGQRQATPTRSDLQPTSTTNRHHKRALASASTLEGERKQITVLCADIKGSTEQVANRDPEEARRLLDPVLQLMMDAVHRYGGTVNQVLGDGIQALFGAPLAFEDHAVRACYAALKMQESIRGYAEQIRRTEGIPLQIRVGMNSGEVLVRSLGSEFHVNYAGQGETMHLAARMEQMAIPGTILITSHTFQLAEVYVVAKPLGPMCVKGLAAPVVVHELQGAKAVRSRLQAVATRGLTRFVGRRNEIEQLRQALEHARAGHGQVVAVVGEPGVGKSRLIHEFIDSGQTGSCRILEAQAVSYGTVTSYLPVTEFLKDFFQIAASDESSMIREKITGKLLDIGGDLLPTLPALLTLLDLPADDPPNLIPDPSQRRQHTLDAVKRVLFRESARNLLLLVLDDLHSIDPETQALIDGIVDALPTARMLLVVIYRPEYHHRWSSKTYYTQIRVDPLAPTVAFEMLNALVGSEAVLDPLKHFLIEKTEGTPFFIEESVRALVETGLLTGKPEGYSATKSISNLRVPSTLEALLTSRIDRLSPIDKRLLQCAAVVGDQVPVRILQAVGELSSDEFREVLSRLQASEHLYETRLFPEIEYKFKHALIQDAAYRMLSRDRRKVLHNAALSAGEQIYANRTSEKVDWLAFHAFRAQVWDRAATYLQAAAAREISRAANRVAAQHLENALIAVDHLPLQERAPLAIDLRIGLRHALTPLGKVERTLQHLHKAEELATELNDKSRLGRIVSFIANCLLLQAQYSQALVTGARAVDIAKEIGDHRLQLTTQMYIARAKLCRGEFRAAIRMYRDIIRSLDQLPLDEFLDLPVLPGVVARSNLAFSLAEGGAFVEAAAHGAEAVRRADASAQPDSIMWANWGVGLVALLQGAPAKAAGVFERLLDMCRVHDLDAYTSRIMGALGCAKARTGQVKEGLALLREAVALDTSAEPQLTKSFTLMAMAEANFLSGDLRQALAIATQVVQRTRGHEERGNQAYACWLTGTIHNSCAECLPAANMFQVATALATELGLQPLFAHCQLGLADLYERQGSSTEASSHRERGHLLLRELGMKPWFNLNGRLSSSL